MCSVGGDRLAGNYRDYEANYINSAKFNPCAPMFRQGSSGRHMVDA
jgi:hypothetical protein